jgi:hypothetical protein
MEASDIPLLAVSLAQDEHHKGTEPEFFTAPGTVTKVYEDEQGTICFVRGTKALRLDIQYVDNDDVKRNMKAMLEGFDKLVEKAKANGFTEICFSTNSNVLKRFCEKYFGFEAVEGNELRKFIA